MNIIKERQTVEATDYSLDFFQDECGGLSFPCDKNGEVIFLCEAAEANYKWALENPDKFPYCFNRFTEHAYSYTEPAVGLCECGEEVELYNQYMGACECPECGRWYNLFGQELESPEFWEDY